MRRGVLMALGVVSLCAVTLWCGRIFSVNRAYSDDTRVVEAAENVSVDGLLIKCRETRIYSIDEYKARFNVDSVDVLSSEDRFICTRLNVDNTTEEPIDWDTVMAATECGFESQTWCSSVNLYSGRELNTFTSNDLEPGMNQDIWYVTSLARVSFSRDTWDNLERESFYYVLTLEPDKLMIRLDIE